MKSILAILALVCFRAVASVDCPTKYPNGNSLAYDDGTLRFQNGNSFRYPDGTIRFPNGNTFRYSDGTFRFENGNTLRYPDGTFRYSNGNTARYPDGTMRDLNGNTVTSGSVLISDSLGTVDLRVLIRKASANFQLNIPWADTLMSVEVNEQGDVICDAPSVPNDPSTSVIRVEGAAGIATVNLKPGHNESAVRRAVQDALNAN